MRGRELLENLARGIRRAVVDANHFPFAGVVLFGESFQRTLCEFFFVTHRHHDRNARGRLRPPVTVRADKPYYEKQEQKSVKRG